MTRPSLEQAYRHCTGLARRHYENFPVASLFLPVGLRKPVGAIYAFARTADDFADEGALGQTERLARLDDYARELDMLEKGGVSDDPVFIALGDVVARYNLPLAPLHDLLQAFRMDVTKTRYADFGELMGYCRLSANPIGRLLLHLYGAVTPRNLGYSDGICSALQLINFYQDIAQDYVENDRIYLPQDEMARFGVTEAHIRERRTDEAMFALMRMQLERAGRILRGGAPLGKALKGRIGFELRLIIAGGMRVLRRLQNQRTDLYSRPRLGAGDAAWILWRAVRAR
jgi:squalene synthase HpnC